MMALIEFETWNDPWKQLAPDGYERLRQIVPQLPESKEEWMSTRFLVDLGELGPIANEFGLLLKMYPTRNGMLVSLKDRIHKLESEMKLTKHDMAVAGTVVQVHIPNIGLLAMNEVKVLDDACTDSLQEALDEGWSILAVCPPNAQRRPDYILGRANAHRRIPA